MSFIKRGDGKIISVVDDLDEESKKSAKEAYEKANSSKKTTDDTNQKSGS